MEFVDCPMITIPLRDNPKEIEQFVSGVSALSQRLDFSPSSVKDVEKEIKVFRKESPSASDEELQALVNDLTPLGYDLGETIRPNVGGAWVKCPELGVPAALDFKDDATWNPIGKVIKFYDDAKIDSAVALYKFLAFRYPSRKVGGQHGKTRPLRVRPSNLPASVDQT